VPGRRILDCWRDARLGLGEDGDLLPVPERTLEVPVDDQCGRIAFRGTEAKDGCSQALQEARECHSSHLENAYACGVEISEAACVGEAEAGLPRH
jgi:hypothetical protein